MWSGTSDEVELEDYAWYEDSSFGRTHPVGTEGAKWAWHIRYERKCIGVGMGQI